MSACLFCFAGLLAASMVDPLAVLADAAPESLLTERMAAGDWNRFRIVTARSTYEFTSLHVDSVGVLLQAAPRRPAMLATPDVRPDTARYVQWADIERVDASRTHAGKGAVEGAIVGGIVGVAVTFLVASNVQDETAVAALGITPLGIVFGALTGAGFWGGSRWTRIYP